MQRNNNENREVKHSLKSLYGRYPLTIHVK